MKAHASVALLLAAGSGAAAAQLPLAGPTVLEAFVARPSVVVRLSEHIGTIESADAEIDVFVVVAEDTAIPRRTMRGARLDFQNNTTLDHIYLDEDELARLRGSLWVMGDFVEEPRPSATAMPGSVQGTADCWMPDPPLRILCPEHVTSSRFMGMRFGTLGGPVFMFPGHQPGVLQGVIEQAIAELERL